MPAESPLEVVEGSLEGGLAPRWPKVKAAHLVYQLRPKVVLEVGVFVNLSILESLNFRNRHYSKERIV
jgi:hypothetical protein